MKIHSTAIENFRTHQKVQKVKGPHESEVKGKSEASFPTYVAIGLMISFYIVASMIYSL